jgi:signal peptidase I
MSFFKKDPRQNLISSMKSLHVVAKKIYNYRRDLLANDQLEILRTIITNLSRIRKKSDKELDNIQIEYKSGLPSLVKNTSKKKQEDDTEHDITNPKPRSNPTSIKEAMLLKRKKSNDELDDIYLKYHEKLQLIGGDIFPQGFLAENAEVMMFAAILALGIRTFFFQPFKIPTNSMFPTYAGMTFELADKKLSKIERLKRFITLGAVRYSMKAKSSGTIYIPLMERSKNKARNEYNGLVNYDIVDTRKWFGLLPTKVRQYTFIVGDSPTSLTVPQDFSLDDVVLEVFFGKGATIDDITSSVGKSAITTINGHVYLSTGSTKRAGEDVLSFDILTGDMLIVNKFIYNFRLPKAGDPVIFKTEKIKDLGSKYYIKRLVGTPGDTLSIDGTTLLRNGMAISGSSAFKNNQLKLNGYPGYVPKGNLANAREVMIPQKNYFVLGDNSPNSLDSRFWGFVPNKEIVGRATFIMYPFTHRWGPAK